MGGGWVAPAPSRAPPIPPSFPMQSIGLLLGSLAMNPKSAQTIASIVSARAHTREHTGPLAHAHAQHCCPRSRHRPLPLPPTPHPLLAPQVMLTFILTGGFFVVDIPSWIAWLRWLSYIFYSLGLLLFIEFEGGTIYRWWVGMVGGGWVRGGWEGGCTNRGEGAG